MKKIKYLLFSLLMFMVGEMVVNAATISLSVNKNSVTVGDTITVTATVSGDDADAWNYCITYSGPVSPTGGTCVTAGSITNGRSASFSFKTTASGTASFGVGDAQVLKFDASDAVVSKGSASVNVVAKQTNVNSNPNGTIKKVEDPRPNVNASTDASLKVLYVDGYELNPAFSKDVYEYSFDVENEIESISIHFATTEDAATVSGAGVRELEEGVNKIELIVTAPKGNQQTYTLTVTRAEKDPIIVKIGDNEYKVVRKLEELGELLNGFTTDTITIDDKEVPVFRNEATKVVLVGLKDGNGKVKLYIYDDGNYSEYKVITGSTISLIPYEVNEKLKGFEKSKFIEIDSIKVEAYYKNDSDTLLLVYGMNVSTGEKNWYIYDTEEGTLQKYYEGFGAEVVTKKDDSFKLIAFIFGAVSLVCLILVFAVIALNKRLRYKNGVLFKMVESTRKGNWEEAVEVSDKDGLSNGKTGVYDSIDTQELDFDGDGEKDFEEDDFKDDDEIDETKEVKELSPAEEKIINNIAKANDESFTETEEIEIEDVPETPVVDEKEETIANTIVDDVTLETSALKVESNVLTKRELRKLTKQQKRQQKIDMKKAQKEFLDDADFGDDSAFDKYVREETEVIPVVEDYKKKTKKAKKDKKDKKKKEKKNKKS